MSCDNTIFNNDKNAQRLTDLVMNKPAVAFVGSGLSSGIYPSWGELNRKLDSRCNVQYGHPIDEKVCSKVLQELAGKARNKDEKEYSRVLLEEFAPTLEAKRAENPERFKEVEEAYGLLMEVSFKSYVTINFDPLLAEQLRRPGSRLQQLVLFPELNVLKLAARNIFYIHGYIEPECKKLPELVLTGKSFEMAYDQAGSKLPTFWRVLLSEYHVIFIGCGLREPEIRFCLDEQQKNRDRTGKNYGVAFPDHYILRPAILNGKERMEEIEKNEFDEYKDKGITIVRYEMKDANHSGLLEVLRSWRELNPISIFQNPFKELDTYEQP